MDHSRRRIVLDVRKPDEFRQDHADRAINIPVQELAQRAGELGPPGPEVLVHCRSGARAAVAAELLRKPGHRVENCVDAAGVARRVAGSTSAPGNPGERT